MKKVAVTSINKFCGTAVVKVVLSMGPEWGVYGMDEFKNFAAVHMCNGYAQVPSVSDPDYVKAVIKYYHEFECGMLIPTSDEDCFVLTAAREELEAADVKLASNSHLAVKISNNKKSSYHRAAAAQIRQPRMFSSFPLVNNNFPVIGKPLVGSGSEGHLVLETYREMLRREEAGLIDRDDYLWQQFIKGQEYCIDTFGHPDSEHFVAVPRVRRHVLWGQTFKAWTVEDPELVAFAAQVCRAFQITEMSCIDVIRGEDGQLYFIEINPRYGSGVSLAVAAGARFPELQWWSLYDPSRIEPHMGNWKAGVEMLRYIEEVFLYPPPLPVL